MRLSDRFVLAAVLEIALAGCDVPKPTPAVTFYDREIGPILLGSCAASPTQSGCHVAADTHGNALGNLNVTSYDDLVKRRDLLISYGPYLMPGILAKVATPFQVRLTTWENDNPIIVTTDIPHAGGALIDVTSSSFNTLITWIQRGASENNALEPPEDLGRTPCSETIPADSTFDLTTAVTTPDFSTFESRVNPVLGGTCGAGNCHGSPGNSLYMTCGKTPQETRWNYFVASDYLSADTQSSELLRRPLAPAAGGTYHEGGTIFQSTSDPGYAAILAWATEKGGPTDVPTDAGFSFCSPRPADAREEGVHASRLPLARDGS